MFNGWIDTICNEHGKTSSMDGWACFEFAITLVNKTDATWLSECKQYKQTKPTRSASLVRKPDQPHIDFQTTAVANSGKIKPSLQTENLVASAGQKSLLCVVAAWDFKTVIIISLNGLIYWCGSSTLWIRCQLFKQHLDGIILTSLLCSHWSKLLY